MVGMVDVLCTEGSSVVGMVDVLCTEGRRHPDGSSSVVGMVDVLCTEGRRRVENLLGFIEGLFCSHTRSSSCDLHLLPPISGRIVWWTTLCLYRR